MHLPPLRSGLAGLALALACGPSSPCGSSYTRRHLANYSRPYAGHWVVTWSDTLTLPDTTLGDRFRLTAIGLDTDTVSVAKQCRLRGHMVFAAPRADTIPVSWFGVPEHVTIFGWPADLGPFAGVNASWYRRDSLRGAILFDERLGVRVQPGATAQFIAGRRNDGAPPAH